MSLTRILSEAVRGGEFLETPEKALQWAKENIDGVQQAFDDLKGSEGKSDWQIRNKEFETERYKSLAYDYSQKYNELKNKSEVTIYRLVKLDSLSDLNLDDVGMHWSFEEDGVGDYGSGQDKYTKGSKEFILTAKTDPRNIDWDYGFHSFIWYGEDQWECALQSNSDVTIIKINDKKLDKPIQAKVDVT